MFRRKRPRPEPRPDYAKILDLEHELGIRKEFEWLEYCREQMIARQLNELKEMIRRA